MTQPLSATEIARSPEAWQRLAKSWLLEVIERSPLEELDELPIAWIAEEAGSLIAEVLGQLTDPGPTSDLRLSPSALARVRSLATGRDAAAAARLPRELSVLQSLLIEALDREIPGRDRQEFSRVVSRLAEVFGALGEAALEAIASSTGQTSRPEQFAPSAQSARADLHALIEDLAGEVRRSGTPFTLAHFEVVGVDRISKGFGEVAAARMADAVADILAGQLAPGQRAFRVEPGSFVAVAPASDARDVAELAHRVGDVIESSQAERDPRVEIAVGIVSSPAHGVAADELIEAAEEAAWAANAAGQRIAFAPEPALQDR